MSARRRFRPYPAYKDSGVEWLGKIPAHWEVKRLKHLATLNPEALTEETDPGYEMSYIDIGGVDSLGRIVEREQLTFASAPSRARRVVRDGDVIISTVRTYLRAIAPIRDPEPRTVVSTGFAVVRPGNELLTDYSAYALRAPYFVERVVANSTGVSFPAINEREMATFELAAPPEPEQRAIAAFLDRETARIDALVAKKKRLIELLQEKRTALITRAVTKGLDPTVPMRDSGVEWLGEIPAHWETVRLGYLVTVGNGSTPTRDEPRFWLDGRYPWLTSAKINEEVIWAADEFVTEAALRECHLPRVRSGSVLVAITGEGQTRGRAALLQVESTISQHLAYLSPSGARLRMDYLRRVLESRYDWLRSESSGAGSTRAALTCEFLRAIQVSVPKNAEQAEIAAFLDCETAKLDALVAKVRDAIDRLKELRTALISAAVTGKIDVREEAA